MDKTASNNAMRIGTVMSWLILANLSVAVVVMFAWWNAASMPATGSTTFIFMFATMGLWLSLFLVTGTLTRLLLLRTHAVKRAEGA